MGDDSTDLDLSGRKIGDYELIRRVGVGGMGVVYEGRHPVIGKRVAVKFLLTALSRDKDLVARFTAEARSVNAIGHRGIVDIFNFGQLEDGTQYFVMEFLEGRPFDQVLATEAPMHPAMVARYLEEILDALAAAHAAGVIHRDIKPSNIFLVESTRARPYIKVLDFGIAKMNAPKTGTTPQTRQSVVIGTPEYIAPEQAQGKAVGPQTDLYAVGCMAFELLTGKLPFRGENPLDTMFKHVVEPTPHAAALVPDIPYVIDELVFRMMQKRPEDRPASALEVLKKLEQVRGGMTAEVMAARPSAPSTGAQAITQPAGPAAFDRTHISRPISVSPPGVPAVAAEPAAPAARATPAPAERPSSARWVFLGLAVLAAGALTAVLLGRRAPEPVIVEPPPPPLVIAALDASVAVAVPRPSPPDASVEVPVVVAPVEPHDAGAPRPVLKKGITAAALAGRISSLEKKLEQREAARGVPNNVLRAFLQQAREDAAKAKTDADRREVWVFLDDVTRQLDR